MAYFVQLWFETSLDTVLQPVKMPGACSAAYVTMHYNEPLKSLNYSGAESRRPKCSYRHPSSEKTVFHITWW